ncbi:hypothetical protein Tco_0619430 [Tanacetum coccineum]
MSRVSTVTNSCSLRGSQRAFPILSTYLTPTLIAYARAPQQAVTVNLDRVVGVLYGGRQCGREQVLPSSTRDLVRSNRRERMSTRRLGPGAENDTTLEFQGERSYYKRMSREIVTQKNVTGSSSVLTASWISGGRVVEGVVCGEWVRGEGWGVEEWQDLSIKQRLKRLASVMWRDIQSGVSGESYADEIREWYSMRNLGAVWVVEGGRMGGLGRADTEWEMRGVILLGRKRIDQDREEWKVESEDGLEDIHTVACGKGTKVGGVLLGSDVGGATKRGESGVSVSMGSSKGSDSVSVPSK